MATLKLSNLGDGSVKWTISGLSSEFTTGNGYVSAGITEYQFTQPADQVYGVISEKSAGISGTKTVSETEYLGAGKYEFWGFTETRLGGCYPAGHARVTITEAPPFISFDWTYAGLDSNGDPVDGSSKRAGLGVYITADEWNQLVALVNDFYGTTVAEFVRPGETISATKVKPLARKLGVPTVYGGDPITASFFNDLRSAYNNLG